jgi:hypothetical protein
MPPRRSAGPTDKSRRARPRSDLSGRSNAPVTLQLIGAQKHPRGFFPGVFGLVGPNAYADVSFTFFSGKLRTGLPVAAKMAFITAGDTTQMVGSPTPPQKS